jgi:hypothetical protein
MKKVAEAQLDDEMASEYDFSKGVRGKYAKQFPAGGKVVVVAPDVAKQFPNSQAVNRALRRLVKLLKHSTTGHGRAKQKSREARTSRR